LRSGSYSLEMLKFLRLQIFKLIIVLSVTGSVLNYEQIINDGHYGHRNIRLGETCDFQVNNDYEFQKCRSRAYEEWYTRDRMQIIKNSCCLDWDIIDCQQKSVQNLCYRSQYNDEYENFLYKKDDWINQNEKYQCKNYRYGSASCHFPIWAILLIVIGSFVVLVGLGTTCYCVIKKRRK